MQNCTEKERNRKIFLCDGDHDLMDCQEECQSCKDNCDSCQLELSFGAADERDDLVSHLVPKPTSHAPVINS